MVIEREMVVHGEVARSFAVAFWFAEVVVLLVKCAGMEAVVARRCCDVACEGVVDERCS